MSYIIFDLSSLCSCHFQHLLFLYFLYLYNFFIWTFFIPFNFKIQIRLQSKFFIKKVKICQKSFKSLQLKYMVSMLYYGNTGFQMPESIFTYLWKHWKGTLIRKTTSKTHENLRKMILITNFITKFLRIMKKKKVNQ